MREGVTLSQLIDIMNENLIPSGSRIINGEQEVYPRVNKAAKIGKRPDNDPHDRD
jgi:hypothetical protein